MTESVETRLTWHGSARPGIHYLGIVVSRTKRVVNTGGNLDHESRAGTVHAAVIAMEKGRTWKYLAGRELQRLVPTEPGLAALPKNESWKHTKP